jgi:hypothetical protein
MLRLSDAWLSAMTDGSADPPSRDATPRPATTGLCPTTKDHNLRSADRNQGIQPLASSIHRFAVGLSAIIRDFFRHTPGCRLMADRRWLEANQAFSLQPATPMFSPPCTQAPLLPYPPMTSDPYPKGPLLGDCKVTYGSSQIPYRRQIAIFLACSDHI